MRRALFVLATLITATAGFGGQPSITPASTGVVVVNSSNTVVMGTHPGFVPDSGDSLVPGDIIIDFGPSSFTDLAYFNKSGAFAAVRIEPSVWSAGRGGAVSIIGSNELTVGPCFLLVSLHMSPGPAFVVSTPKVRLIFRPGSEVQVGVDASGEATIEVLTGSVYVQPIKSGPRLVLSTGSFFITTQRWPRKLTESGKADLKTQFSDF